MWSLSFSQIPYCTVLTLLVRMREDEMPDLFLTLYDPPLLSVNGLVSLFSGDPLLKLSYRLQAFWHNALPSVRTCFLFMSPTHKFNDFSIFTQHVSYTVAVTCSLSRKSKTSTNFFFLSHKFMERRFVLMVDLSIFSNFFLYYVENFHLFT